MKYIIEKGVPLPENKAEYRASYPKYPFAQMEVGDSFIVSATYTRTLMTKFSNATRAWVRKRDNGWKFATRKVTQGIRIWRVE